MAKFGFRRVVKSTQVRTRIMGFRVDGTGTASITAGSGDATLTDNGTGDYTLTWNEAFQRAPVCVATCTTNATYPEIQTPTTTAVQILTVASGDGSTATDADFEMIVHGWDSSDEV